MPIKARNSENNMQNIVNHDQAVELIDETNERNIVVCKGLEWDRQIAIDFINALVKADDECTLSYIHDLEYAPYVFWNTNSMDKEGYKFKHHQTGRCILMEKETNNLIYY